jgi:alkanesulfonate monooxygenase SsuD/methylene tetrahydromethanopterin reductase-like flavin-dependent oxidoreductase (luciferase family)
MPHVPRRKDAAPPPPACRGQEAILDMELSLFFEIETADMSEAGVRRCFDECIEQVVAADRLGYRAAWFVEHHFLPFISYSTSPELMLAHLAARTSNIRLGHGIVLLPFKINHPVRVAERIAMLDVLSRGRVEFGGGRSTTDAELSGFGIDPEATRPQWEEALRVLPRMWTEEYFHWDSPTLSIPQRQVVPKPVQKPHPPMWVACNQPSTVQFAARNGLGVLGFGIGQNDPDNFVRIYREGLKDAQPLGKFINPKFALLTFALCCPTDREAFALQGPNVRRYARDNKVVFAPWLEGKTPPSYQWQMAQLKQQFEAMATISMKEMVKAGGACIGSPETCLNVLQFLSDAGVDEALLFMQMYTTPHDQIMRSIELIAKEVAPRLKPRPARAAAAAAQAAK